MHVSTLSDFCTKQHFVSCWSCALSLAFRQLARDVAKMIWWPLQSSVVLRLRPVCGVEWSGMKWSEPEWLELARGVRTLRGNDVLLRSVCFTVDYTARRVEEQSASRHARWVVVKVPRDHRRWRYLWVVSWHWTRWRQNVAQEPTNSEERWVRYIIDRCDRWRAQSTNAYLLTLSLDQRVSKTNSWLT